MLQLPYALTMTCLPKWDTIAREYSGMSHHLVPIRWPSWYDPLDKKIILSFLLSLRQVKSYSDYISSSYLFLQFHKVTYGAIQQVYWWMIPVTWMENTMPTYPVMIAIHLWTLALYSSIVKASLTCFNPYTQTREQNRSLRREDWCNYQFCQSFFLFQVTRVHN